MKRTDEWTSRVGLSGEFADKLGELIDNVTMDWEGHASGVGELAAQLDALPLLVDVGGFIALKRDGRLVQVDWDSPRVEVALPTIRHRDLALISGARRYGDLAALCPQRTTNSRTCRYCSGTGVAPQSLGSTGAPIVCWCGGLGWTPSTWSE